MQEIVTGRVVLFRVTEEALRKMTGSATRSLQTMFEQARQEAEELASVKYDRWPAVTVVTQRDVGKDDARHSSVPALASQTRATMASTARGPT
jgi:hypothetical protein